MKRVKRWTPIGAAMAAGLLLMIYGWFYRDVIKPAEWMQIMLFAALVVITGIYAWATAEQAEASVRMAEEMREQRVVASRPIIIQKPVEQKLSDDRVQRGFFSHFVVINVGNGPALEVEVSLLDKEKSLIIAHRETFLRTGEQHDFLRNGEHAGFDALDALVHQEESTYYLVSEYRCLFPRSPERPWCQTWLPFKLIKTSKENCIFVNSGEMEFHDEVAKSDLVDAFVKGNKPK